LGERPGLEGETTSGNLNCAQRAQPILGQNGNRGLHTAGEKQCRGYRNNSRLETATHGEQKKEKPALSYLFNKV